MPLSLSLKPVFRSLVLAAVAVVTASLALGGSRTSFAGPLPTPLSLRGFEPNRGQLSGCEFAARASDGELRLSRGEARFLLHNRADTSVRSLTMRLAEGASPAGKPSELLPGRVSYFLGQAVSSWRTGVPLFGRVTYPAIRPGIDLVFYASEDGYEYDLMIQPGAHPDDVQLQLEGADAVSLAGDGSLRLKLGTRTITHARPTAYQEVNGTRRIVPASFQLGASIDGHATASFTVGEFDRSRPLIIDPVVTYSTYLGGGGYDEGTSIAVDPQGNTYVAGVTDSINFPGAGLPPPGGGGAEAFVAKISAEGDLVYAAYLGGDSNDVARGITAHADGSVTLAGSTLSGNFPTLAAVQASAPGGLDGFVTRVNAAGTALVFSTYLGGSSDEMAVGVGSDAQGAAVVAGWTYSLDFPTLQALQPNRAGSQLRTDGFVSRFNATGALMFSTYLGGSANELINGIAVSPGGGAWVAGYTESNDLPLLNAFQTQRTGTEGDGFVACIVATGLLTFSTYLGGSAGDAANAIAVDSQSRAYVAGVTESADFPPASNGGHGHGLGVQHTQFNGGEGDAFAVRFSAQADRLEYSHLIGGTGFETANAIGVDAIGRSYLAGFSDSPDVTSLYPVQPGYGGGSRDAFLVGVNARGSAHTFVSYFGGGNSERARAIAVLPSGEARITGETSSNDFLKVDAWQAQLGGVTVFGGDAFVTTLTGPTPPPPPTELIAAARSGGSIRLSWLDQSDDETGFSVERIDPQQNVETVASAGPNVQLAEDSTPDRDVLYRYRVRATNQAGSAVSAEVQAGVSPTARLRLSHPRLDFGKFRTGAVRTRTLRLRNLGRSPVTVWLEAPPAPFALMTPAMVTVPGRGSAVVGVQLDGANAGRYQGELTMRSTDPRRPGARVRLIGRVLPPRE